VIALSWYAAGAFEQFYLNQTARNLEAQAILVKEQVERLDRIEAGQLNRLVGELGSATQTRITLVALDGTVVGDSDEDPGVMDNHADRPEIIEAHEMGKGTIIRYSHTLGQDMMYLAIPLNIEGKFSGVVRTSLPLERLSQTVANLRGRIALAGVFIIVLAGMISYIVSRRISRPLERMKQGAERFAAGELERRLPVPGADELGSLAESMNDMARQMDERISTITFQRNEREAMLSSMEEGVLAVDMAEKVIRVNRAAARLFEIDVEPAEGRPVQEVFRHPGLLQLVERLLAGEDKIEEELIVYTEREVALQASGTPLRDDTGTRLGALIVLNDITRLKHLEDMRREFVANVSHELKTPITSVMGFVETLRSGEAHKKEDVNRFLEIIARHTDRLNAIIDDLLTLSRIEQQESDTKLELTRTKLLPILENAIQDCAPVINEKRAKVTLTCDEELEVPANVQLLEQALVNLIDNAVKYGNRDGKVEITVRKDKQIHIQVTDEGPGIATKHLPHLFTRFYRTKKGRSRSEGGTGLGLAIVKHIALAHGGSVEVESTLGKGSTFSLRLPV
jgi:two-component system phosphate regulon sensor histidine kinase PhoR